MKHSHRLSIVLSTAVLSTASMFAQNYCPLASPGTRPAGATPSSWNLAKVLNTMVTPAPNLILVTSHRGNWEYCPENTLEAFQSAWDLGAIAAEMDVRMSSTGQVFLSHDYDIRGEAPLANSGTEGTTNNIYNLTPAQLSSRQMADRHGNPAYSFNYYNGQPGEPSSIVMPSFNALLTSLYQRAQTVQGGIAPGSSPIRDPTTRLPWDLVTRGMLLVVDVKSAGQSVSGSSTSMMDTFQECLRELNAFQIANHVDLRYALAFKVGFSEMTGLTWAANGTSPTYIAPSTLISSYITNLPGWQPNQALPYLIFIVFPFDLMAPSASGKPSLCRAAPQGNPSTCTLVPVASHPLNDYLNNYKQGTTNYFLVNDWQYWNPGNAIETYLASATWNLRGMAMFMASNNFAEGVRNSSGNCSNTFNPPPGQTGHNPNDLINTSYCTSDPVQRWGSAAIDYLAPYNADLLPSGLTHRSTSITTDQYLNAVNYLTTIGYFNTTAIQ